MIRAEHVSRIYVTGKTREVRAVDDVSLVIECGEFVGLCGPSGAGKSTLLALLGALDRPSSGQLWLDGHEIAHASDIELTRLRRHVGFVFQSLHLPPRLPVWESATYGLIPRGVSRRERLSVAASLFERLGIGDLLERRPDELSGGEQQRVAIARALVAEPRLLLADEPTSNLDRQSATELLALLARLHTEGLTIVVSSHDQELISRVHRRVFLEHGRVRTQELSE